ncbi:hypothetical protein CXB51_020913 [Gossypium anomalum]|uniref:Serine-threonine kinase receptor-associated protein n=1 Tax=Gossypium anomalum TaxID=47600 RepID=A0A8J5YRA6_9ROSI|nr:hypothetical protein CXB51_020913 [Gossypium anomalum]
MEKKRVAVPILCHGHSRPVVDLFYSPVTPDGFFLVSASKDSYPMLRNGETGDCIGTFEGHKGAVWSVCLDTNALRAASGSADFSAKVWDALTGDVLHSFEHKHIVRACAFSEDTHLLLTGGVEKVLRVYDLNRPDAVPGEVDKSPGSVRTVSWMHSDQTILSSCTDMGGVRLWDVRSGEIVKTLETESSVTSAEVSQDGRYILTADGSTVKIWDANHFGLVRRYNMPCTVESASLEPIYGNKFIAGGEDMWVRVFDFQSGDEIGMFSYINLSTGLYFLVITGFTSGPQHVTRVIMVRYTVCDSHRKGNLMPQDPRMEPLEYGTGPLTHNDTEPFAANGSMVETLGTLTGKLWISSIHGFFSFAGFIVLKAFHTALLHLNPEPNAICHVRSPFLIRPLASECCQTGKESFSMVPCAIQTAANSSPVHLKRLFHRPKKSNCSDIGRTRGPNVVMLVFKASPATPMRSFDNVTPICPVKSSSCVTHPKHLSSAPLWVRTSNIAAPPILNKQFETSFERSFPKYQFKQDLSKSNQHYTPFLLNYSFGYYLEACNG